MFLMILWKRSIQQPDSEWDVRWVHLTNVSCVSSNARCISLVSTFTFPSVSLSSSSSSSSSSSASLNDSRRHFHIRVNVDNLMWWNCSSNHLSHSPPSTAITLSTTKFICFLKQRQFEFQVHTPKYCTEVMHNSKAMWCGSNAVLVSATSLLFLLILLYHIAIPRK